MRISFVDYFICQKRSTCWMRELSSIPRWEFQFYFYNVICGYFLVFTYLIAFSALMVWIQHIFIVENIWNRQAFSLVVKTLVHTPVSRGIRIPRSNTGSGFRPYFLSGQTPGSSNDGSCMGDLFCVLAYSLQSRPAPVMANIWGVNQWMGALSISQIN